MIANRQFEGYLRLMMVVLVWMMIYLLFGLVKPVTVTSIAQIVEEKDTMRAVLISITSIVISVLFVVVIGTLLAYKMRGDKSKLALWAHRMVMLPLLLPPTVAGLVLLQGFGRNSLLSIWIFGGNLNMSFSFMAIVVAQIYVTLPFYYQMTLNAFEKIDQSYIEAAQVCGASNLLILSQIMIPMSRKSMLAGAYMSVLRGLSEFGATIMFAGNMAGRTQTITTRIYQLYQSDTNSAFTLAVVQLCFFLIPYYFIVGRKSTKNTY